MAGTGSTFSAPSVILNGNAVNIAAMGPDHRLKYYWAIDGIAPWHAETVPGNGSTYSAPSMILNTSTVNIAVLGPGNRLRYYWVRNGSTAWNPETVAGKGSTYSVPSMMLNGEAANITAVGVRGPAEVLLGRQRQHDLARRDGCRGGQGAVAAPSRQPR